MNRLLDSAAWQVEKLTRSYTFRIVCLICALSLFLCVEYKEYRELRHNLWIPALGAISIATYMVLFLLGGSKRMMGVRWLVFSSIAFLVHGILCLRMGADAFVVGVSILCVVSMVFQLNLPKDDIKNVKVLSAE